MGVFGNIFGRNKEKKETQSFLRWIPLTELSQIETIKNQSNAEAILIFKHSTRCVISKMAIQQFEKLFNETNQQLKVYYLDLLNHKDISNELASTFDVFHQSPQLIVIKNEQSIFDASHQLIVEADLSRFL